MLLTKHLKALIMSGFRGETEGATPPTPKLTVFLTNVRMLEASRNSRSDLLRRSKSGFLKSDKLLDQSHTS